MKKYILLSTLLLFIVFSCKKIDKKTQFNIENTTQSTIPSALGVNLPFDIPTPTITTNIEQEMEEHNSHKDLIEYANLKELKLSINDPTSANFDFLNDMEIFIKTDGLDKQKIAEIHNIPENQLKKLSLSVIPNIDLQNYIKADKYYLDITVKTDKINLQDVTLDIYSKVFVDAKILGV
jgi:hypothetical protein